MLQLAAQLIALQIVILLLIRPLLLWYFRINDLAKLLQSIDRSLKCLPAVRTEAQRSRADDLSLRMRVWKSVGGRRGPL